MLVGVQNEHSPVMGVIRSNGKNQKGFCGIDQ